jgi:hypothetical protein
MPLLGVHLPTVPNPCLFGLTDEEFRVISEKLYLLGQLLGTPVIIGVQKCDERCAGSSDAGVSGSRNPPVVIMGQIPDCRRKRGWDLRSVVCGSVVHND